MQDESMINDIIDSLKLDLEKSVDYLKGEYQVIRAGRANPHILDKIMVDYYGSMTPLYQMANIAVQEARLLTVNLYDITQIKAVLKAIAEADLGVNISDAQKAELTTLLGGDYSDEIKNNGYYLQIVDATASIRQARKTPSINLVYTYGGSVHKLVVPATAVV